MPTASKISAKEFGESFRSFLEQMNAQAPVEEPLLLRRLRDHFEGELSKYPVVAEEFKVSDHPNLHLAIERSLSGGSRSAERMGVITDTPYLGVSMSQLLQPAHHGLVRSSGVSEGPIEYRNLSIGDGNTLSCIQSGLFLIRESESRLAMLVRGPNESSMRSNVSVEVMAPNRELAENYLTELRTSIHRHNVYRGHVVSLVTDEWRRVHVQFHDLPRIERRRIILPQGLLERIERQTVRFSQHASRLMAAGRHLKRGALLYGPPGTGKTLTAMYLAGEMKGRTVLVLTGRGLGMIEESCRMARLLQPATVILEDVDLVAEERTHNAPGCTALLFELLNQMDGLSDDADVLFLLTTNRAELLEPALASRPGRVDFAIEVPLPDAECRRRLFQLYAEGLTLGSTDLELYIRKTEGVSAAFIRELLRKAALFCAEDGDSSVVEDQHLKEALHELIVDGGELTKLLLGAARPVSRN